MTKYKIRRNVWISCVLCLISGPVFAQGFSTQEEGGYGRRSSRGGDRDWGSRDRGMEGRGFGREAGRDWGNRGESRPDFGGRPDFSRMSPTPPAAPFRSGVTPATPVTYSSNGASSNRSRVTTTLPAHYAIADLDGDGQIAFYEWKLWKKGDFAGFSALDHNGDGFLTPAELLRGSAVSSMAIVSATPSPANGSPATAPGVAPRTEAGAPATQAVSITPAAPEVESDAQVTARAEQMFKMLDSNRDGVLSATEWKRSTRISQKFTGDGISLEEGTPKEDFVKHYVRLKP